MIAAAWGNYQPWKRIDTRTRLRAPPRGPDRQYHNRPGDLPEYPTLARHLAACGEFWSNGQGGIVHDSWGWVTLSDVNGAEMLSYEREPPPALRWLYYRSNPGADSGYYGLCSAASDGLECVYVPRWAVVGDSQYIAPYFEGAEGYQEVERIFSP
ncbi:hypothetical protein BJX65DRAFT_307088 [Aspergillus insuetus]